MILMMEVIIFPVYSNVLFQNMIYHVYPCNTNKIEIKWFIAKIKYIYIIVSVRVSQTLRPQKKPFKRIVIRNVLAPLLFVSSSPHTLANRD